MRVTTSTITIRIYSFYITLRCIEACDNKDNTVELWVDGWTVDSLQKNWPLHLCQLYKWHHSQCRKQERRSLIEQLKCDQRIIRADTSTLAIKDKIRQKYRTNQKYEQNDPALVDQNWLCFLKMSKMNCMKYFLTRQLFFTVRLKCSKRSKQLKETVSIWP